MENLLQRKFVSKDEIVITGKNILEQLTDSTRVLEPILGEYIALLEEVYLEHKEVFISEGYKIINQYIADNKEITTNMIMFDCYMIKSFLNITLSINFEFYSDCEDDSLIKHNAGCLYINTASIKHLYENSDNKKIASQYLMFAIGHELEHVYMFEHEADIFKIAENKSIKEVDLKTALRMFNIKISFALQSAVSDDFYKCFHDSFTHEHDCNIVGIQLLYNRYNYLPSITAKDKKEFNKILASIILDAYSHNINGDLYYLGPVNFTRVSIKHSKDDLPNYQVILLSKLKDLSPLFNPTEEQLTDEDKFLLGYYTPYINVLSMIANGAIASINLFEDLPSLYKKYYRQINSKK